MRFPKKCKTFIFFLTIISVSAFGQSTHPYYSIKNYSVNGGIQGLSYHNSLYQQRKINFNQFDKKLKQNSINFADTIDTSAGSKNDTATFKNKLDKFNSTMEKVIVYAPFPFVSYAIETDWVFGLAKYNGFRIRSGDIPDSLIQPSSITGLIYYTVNNQYKITANADLMFGQNQYKTTFGFAYFYYPSLYYGLGNDTKVEDERVVLYKTLKLHAKFMYNVTKSWYLGIGYDYINDFQVEFDTIYSERDTLLKEFEGVQSGLELSYTRETRDNRINAKKGSYIFADYQFFTKWLGSKFKYRVLTIDLRKYITPLKFLTIAGQLYSEAATGDVPVQSMAFLGGPDRMRGIYAGRYRDKTSITGQIELRFPLVWIISGVTFASVGQVAPDYRSYYMDGFKLAGGWGLRLMIDSATRSTIRLDFGFSKDQRAIYFGFNEAF
jgi:hypothetical protein